MRRCGPAAAVPCDSRRRPDRLGAVPECQICAGSPILCERFAPYPFLECPDCGFVFRPDLDDAKLAEVYTAGAYELLRAEEYLRQLPDRRRDARVRLRYLRRWSEKGRLLDVGASAGAFVYEARSGGFDASGIEPVPAFAKMAGEHFGVHVTEGTLSDTRLQDGSYQAITLWHVLEHLPDPVSHLRQIVKALTPDGLVALEVPNAGSTVACKTGAQWTSLEPDVHVNQFTPRSLRTALDASGLTVLDLQTTMVTPYLKWPRRLGPGHLAARVKALAWLRSVRTTHPEGHELLRAVARKA